MPVAERKVKAIERRNELRVNVSEPVRLRPVTDPVSSEQLAETLNMSEHGLCIATKQPVPKERGIGLRSIRAASLNRKIACYIN